MISILILFSIISWAIIIQRSKILSKALKQSMTFEERFWSGEDLTKLYEGLSNRRDGLSGSEQIFLLALKNFPAFNKLIRMHQNLLFKEVRVQCI